MKKINIIISCLILLTACRKDLLDLTPQDRISDADFWKSTNDLQLYANGFYSRILPAYADFSSNALGIYGLDSDEGSDNMIGTAGYNSAMNGERVVPASGGGWNTAAWQELRNINYFLANYQRVQAAASAVNPYVGEALFFRAWFYFDKLKSFGDLPWINKPLLPTDTAMIYSSRIKRNIIADSIIADLDRAISLLPTKASAQAMRINKEIAMAFLSRVALFEGTWEKYHANTAFGVQGSDGSKYLVKAAQVAETLIDANIYQLDNVGVGYGYWRLFNLTDYSGSKEVLFWRKYTLTDNPPIAHNWVRYIVLGGGRGLTKNMVDYYLCIDGKPIAGNPLYKGDDSLTKVVANRDPRLAQTIAVPDVQHLMTASQPAVYFTVPRFVGTVDERPATGYQVYKGLNTDPAQQSNVFTSNNTGLIFFRYAEVLLNFAEAKAELGTLTQSDVDKSIKKLRDRVGMPNLVLGSIVTDPNWEFPTLSPVINEVRRERRVELACEGFRRSDIFRWAAADELIVGWKPKGAKRGQWTTLFTASVLAAYPVDANGYIELYKNVAAMSAGYKFNVNRDYLSPIPTDQRTLNPKLNQNPGW
jgi:starch-binding outer membrane protein, SusD/RagB family